LIELVPNKIEWGVWIDRICFFDIFPQAIEWDHTKNLSYNVYLIHGLEYKYNYIKTILTSIINAKRDKSEQGDAVINLYKLHENDIIDYNTAIDIEECKSIREYLEQPNFHSFIQYTFRIVHPEIHNSD
jgi:hypothetical protein